VPLTRPTSAGEAGRQLAHEETAGTQALDRIRLCSHRFFVREAAARRRRGTRQRPFFFVFFVSFVCFVVRRAQRRPLARF